MDTVNAKKRWETLVACPPLFEQFYTVTRLSLEKAPFLKINNINDISFLERSTASLLFYSVSGNANSMVIQYGILKVS
jgi:hypothetical protein